MNDLTPEAQALLDTTRNELSSTAQDRDRVGRAIALRIGVAAGTIVATTATATTSAAATGGAGATFTATVLASAKWAVATALIAAVGAGSVAAYRRSDLVTPSGPSGSRPTTAAAAKLPPGPTAESPVVRVTPLADARGPLSAPLTRNVRAVASIPPSGAVNVRPAANAPRVAPVEHPAVAPPPETQQAEGASPPEAPTPSLSLGSVGRETALLRRAHEALEAGDPSGALALLDEHAQTFPSGALAEERSAERVVTLCKLGRTSDAHTEAERFLSRTPGSPLAESVRRSCGERAESFGE